MEKTPYLGPRGGGVYQSPANQLGILGDEHRAATSYRNVRNKGIIVANIGFAEAFARYNAKLKNVQWSVCAINDNDELVVSLWEHHRDKTQKDKLVFTDRFDRWSGLGNSEFRDNVTHAFKSNQDVRLIIVATQEINAVQDGNDASKVRKSFRVRPELIGKVTGIDGEQYTISFVREERPGNWRK